MNYPTRHSYILMILITFLILLSACGGGSVGGGTSKDQESDQSVDHEFVPVEITDYSKYKVIEDPVYYQDKALGEIFIIKLYTIPIPKGTMKIFGHVFFSFYPDQSFDALQFKDPTKPTILIGYGEGWGIMDYDVDPEGKAHCSCEYKAKFRLRGGLYSEPQCTLDVDIETEHFVDEPTCGCTWAAGLEIKGVVDPFTDIISDVRPPIVFQLPNDYIVKHELKNSVVNYDIAYILRWFRSKLPVSAEESLIFPEDVEAQFDIGCGNIDLEYVGADELGFDLPVFSFDDLLVPDSQKEAQPQSE